MNARIQLKLLIDKDTKRVIFTESDGAFVDTLLSFLALPLGSVVRLLDSQSTVGSIDNLHRSVANLDKRFLKTPECLHMLTRPRIASSSVKVRMDDCERPRFYICEYGCENNWVATTVAKCCCGKLLAGDVVFEERQGGFVKGVFKYIITDDLQVRPVSTSSAAFGLIKEIGFGESSSIEEKSLTIGAPQNLNTVTAINTIQNTQILCERFYPNLHLHGKLAREIWSYIFSNLSIPWVMTKNSENLFIAWRAIKWREKRAKELCNSLPLAISWVSIPNGEGLHR